MNTSNHPGRIRAAATLAVLAIASTLIVCTGCSSPSSESTNDVEASPPNVLLIVMDTTRADHLSHTGWRNDTSPNLSALLEDAVLYSAAHSVAPWTMPSHMSLFTGQLPGEHGAHWAAFDPEDERTLAEFASQTFQPADIARMLPRRLQEQGYATVGVSNNPWISSRTGFAEGFDVLYPAWKETIRPNSSQAPSPREVSISGIPTGSAGKSLQVLNHHIRSQGLAEPFFLFFNFIDPHYPYLAPGKAAQDFGGDPDVYQRLADPDQRASEFDIIAGKSIVEYEPLVPLYDACIYHVDVVIGRLIQWLKDHDLYDNTMIVVTADHGEHLGEEGRFSHQLSVQEELLQIPLVIKYPEGRGAGQVEEHPHVSIVDVYKTILAASGAGNSLDSSTGDSLDLADMDSFIRPYAFAEYHFADAYLSFFKSANPDFDLEPHRSTYHVIYTGGRKFIFKDLELDQIEILDPSAPGEIDPATRELLTQLLTQYGAGSASASRSSVNLEDDPEFLDALRALGYLGED